MLPTDLCPHQPQAFTARCPTEIQTQNIVSIDSQSTANHLEGKNIHTVRLSSGFFFCVLDFVLINLM